MFKSKLEAFRKQNNCILTKAQTVFIAFPPWHLLQRNTEHSFTFPYLEIWGSSLIRGALCCYFQKQLICPNNLTFTPLLTTCFRAFWHFMNLYRPCQDNRNLMFLEHYWFSLWFFCLGQLFKNLDTSWKNGIKWNCWGMSNTSYNLQKGWINVTDHQFGFLPIA